MSKIEWRQLPEEFRNTVISIFRMRDIDFEEVFLEQKHGDNREDSHPYMTRNDAADYANVSTDTIDNWCAQGYIEKSKLGGGKAGTVLISRESLEKHIRSCVVKHPKRVRKDLAPSVKGGYRA